MQAMAAMNNMAMMGCGWANRFCQMLEDGF
jgi:hypothetical protein